MMNDRRCLTTPVMAALLPPPTQPIAVRLETVEETIAVEHHIVAVVIVETNAVTIVTADVMIAATEEGTLRQLEVVAMHAPPPGWT